jgi:outer membrane protein OmpA-like peptidoglycan-associated protein
LDNKALSDITRALKSLEKLNVSRVELFGFADNVGSFSENMKLSIDRANVVKDQLKLGNIECDVHGFSYEMPVGDNRTDAGRRKNRRVEIWAEVPASAFNQ